MSVTIELTAQECPALKPFTRLQDDGEAVARAAHEFLRFSHVRELKSMSGGVEFEANSRRLELSKVNETDLPHIKNDVAGFLARESGV